MSSKIPIRSFSNGYSFFVAAGDKDGYFADLSWNETICDWQLQVGTLQEAVKNSTLWPEYIRGVYNALLIVSHNNNFYIVTKDWFYIENMQFISKIKIT